MSTAASAVATVDSATTTATPVEPARTADWTPAQLEQWNKDGSIPRLPKSADSATATEKNDKKDKAAPDSAPDKKDKTAVNASDSATDKKNEPHLKTPEDTEKRFKEILDENKALQRRLESLERGDRGKPSETRDGKQVSQPAAEVKVPPLKSFLEQYFAKPENAGGKKTYEDGVEAWQEARDAESAKRLERNIREQIANEAAQQRLSSSVEEAKKRYPEYEARVQPAVQAIANDPQIPMPVKAVLNDSPVFVDLLYVLAEPKALADFVQTAKTNPAAAIRKIVLTEQLVMAELAKANGKGAAAADDKAGDGAGDGKERDATGKFVSSDGKKDAASDPKPRAPKPPAEVGGRGASSEAADVAAARTGNFSAFEAEQNRKVRAALS
jgi:hypothetical protein